MEEKKITALVVFASLTGNTEDVAIYLSDSLKALGVKVNMEECTQTNPEEFLKYDLCCVATYTYGADGDLPDEIVDFYERLKEIDLTGKVYGALGSGDTVYGHFCESADDFDAQFQLTHATKGSEVLKVDLDVEVEDAERIDVFAKELVETYHRIKAAQEA